MMDNNEFFYSIRNDSLKLIYEKNIDLDFLAFELGLDKNELVSLYDKQSDDLFIYLKIYNKLVEW